MNLEQLQAMSDAELNELSAVKVMGKLYQNGKMWEKAEETDGHRLLGDWNPAADMNDAILLIEVLKKKIMPINMFPVYPTGWHCHVHKANKLLFIVPSDSLPRAITLSSILALE